MNFKQFIKEDLDLDNYKKTKEIIQKDCLSFLKESKGLPLYRGTNLRHADEIVEDLYKGTTKAKRTPIDELDYYNIFEPAFESVYGVKNIRSSHAAFTTGDYESAEIYSSIVNLFFPISDYTYWWSPSVETGYHLYNRDFKYGYNKYNDKKAEIEAFTNLLTDVKYTNTNLFKGIKSSNEIIFKVKEYYLIPIKYFTTDEINELMEYLTSGI